jgi:hypothetical protein
VLLVSWGVTPPAARLPSRRWHSHLSSFQVQRRRGWAGRVTKPLHPGLGQIVGSSGYVPEGQLGSGAAGGDAELPTLERDCLP